MPCPLGLLLMSSFFSFFWVATALLNLHRPYFAQALNDGPQDLLKHRYAPSVLAIYRSAWRIIEALRMTQERVPFVTERWGMPWSLSMSAAVCEPLFRKSLDPSAG